jgi:hypothetical protein
LENKGKFISNRDSTRVLADFAYFSMISHAIIH